MPASDEAKARKRARENARYRDDPEFRERRKLYQRMRSGSAARVKIRMLQRLNDIANKRAASLSMEDEHR